MDQLQKSNMAKCEEITEKHHYVCELCSTAVLTKHGGPSCIHMAHDKLIIENEKLKEENEKLKADQQIYLALNKKLYNEKCQLLREIRNLKEGVSDSEEDLHCDLCGTSCMDHTSNNGRGTESPCVDCEENRCKRCPCGCDEEDNTYIGYVGSQEEQNAWSGVCDCDDSIEGRMAQMSGTYKNVEECS